MSVQPRKTKKGTVYDVRFRGPDGKVRTQTFQKKGEAERFDATRKAAKYQGSWVDPSELNRRFGDVAEEWLGSNVAKRGSTLARDRSALDTHILPLFKNVKVGEIRRRHVRAAVEQWSLTLEPRSVERVFGVLRAVLNFAFEESEGNVRNPCTGVKLPRKTKRRRPRVTPDVLLRIAEAMPPRYEPMVWIAAIEGLRWGEVAGITVGQLTLLGRGSINVDRQVARDEHGNSIVSEPKSEAGTRELSAPDELRDLLAAHLASLGLTAADEEALIFPAPEGGLLDYSHFYHRIWKPALIEAGCSEEVPDPKRPGRTKTKLLIGFHDLRRANATEMARLGVDPKTGQYRMGHTDPRLFLALYAEATTEADEDAADRLGDAWLGGGAEDGPGRRDRRSS